MVSKIRHPQDIHRAIYYNEHKVEKGVANLLHAENFLKDADQLTVVEKKQRFDDLIALNQAVDLNTLHAIIGFAPGEQLAKEKLIAIANEYMERIGFGDQPYLVYQHTDAGHPHLHIVSTNIQGDGTRIEMNRIGIEKSEPARKAIEEKYGLVKAEGRKREKGKDDFPRKIIYGQTDTKRAITNVLEHLLPQYRYRSLPELNALLGLYNLRADRGDPGTRVYQHRGLLYHVLDEDGKKVSVPLKASAFHFKPGLDYLEKKFEENKTIDPSEKQVVKKAVDAAIGARPASLEAWVNLLRQEKIETVLYYNKEGKLYGMTFVHIGGRFVIKASDLRKGYSAGKILLQLGLDPQRPEKFSRKKEGPFAPKTEAEDASKPPIEHDLPGRSDLKKAFDLLFRPEGQEEKLPHDLSQDRKKKKKRKR